VVTRLVPLFRREDRETITPDDVGTPVEIEGELGDYLVVSIPPSESHATAEFIKNKVAEMLGRTLPILVVTHNMEFLVSKQLRPKEGAKILKQMEAAIYGKPTQATKDADSDQAARVGAEPGAADDRGGSGVGVDGSGGAGAGRVPDTAGAGSGVGADEEGEQEGEDTPPSIGG